MPGFTTRPEIRGTFGVVATTHWLASSVAMGVLEKGGNAFDAAVAAGFTLQVVEPHLYGPLGEAPDSRLQRQEPPRRDDLRPGRRPAGRDNRALQEPRPRSDPRHRPLGRDRAGRVRRLGASRARLRHDAARRADGAGARLRRERLSARCRKSATRSRASPNCSAANGPHRRPSICPAATRRPPESCSATRRWPRPTAACWPSPRPAPAAANNASSAPATPGTRALSPRRSTASAARNRSSTPPAGATAAS